MKMIVILNPGIEYSEELMMSVMMDLYFSRRIEKILYWKWKLNNSFDFIILN